MSYFKSREHRNDIIRPLDPAERLFSSLHATYVHFGIIVSCRYTVPPSVSKNAVKDSVSLAIASSVLEHPILCVGIAGEKSIRPVWVRLDMLDLNFHVKWRNIEDTHDGFGNAFKETVQPLVDTPFEDIETRPIWRITVLQPNKIDSNNWVEVVFAYSHAIGDGVAGRIFHESLLYNLCNLSMGDKINQQQLNLKGTILYLPKLTQETFTPPPGDLIDYTFSLPWALRTLWQELRPTAFIKKMAIQWAPLWDGISTSTRWRLFHINPTGAAQILTACQKHKTTLTALVHVLTLLAFCSLTPEDQGTWFTGDTFINMRRFIKKKTIDPENTMMSMITILRHKFDSDLVRNIRQQLCKELSVTQNAEDSDLQYETLWKLAADIKVQLTKRVDSGAHNLDIGLAKFIPNTNEYWEQELKKPRKTTWGVSNIGVISNRIPDGINDSREDGWKIEKCVFTQGMAKPTEAYDVSLAGVKDGSIAVSCIWEGGTFSDELGTRIASDIEQRLGNIADSIKS